MFKLVCILYCIVIIVLFCLLCYYIKQTNYFRNACDKEYREKLKYRSQRDQAISKLNSTERMLGIYEGNMKGRVK